MSKKYKYHNIKRGELKVGLECWHNDGKAVVVALKDNVVALEAYDSRGVFLGYKSKQRYTIADHYKTRVEIKTVTKCDSCPMLNSCGYDDKYPTCRIDDRESEYFCDSKEHVSDNCPLEYIKYKDGAEFRPLEIEQ